jgi:hypothetical protein
MHFDGMLYAAVGGEAYGVGFAEGAGSLQTSFFRRAEEADAHLAGSE